MAKHTFSLRAMQPADSAEVAALITTDDGELTTHFQIDAYTAITAGTVERTVGVVAECDGYEGLVGMGTVSFSAVQYNGAVLPSASLDGLKVRPAFRGQGLGRRLAAWRVQHARDTYGDDCVIFTGLTRDNHASRAVAKTWCRDIVEPLPVAIMPTRARPPRAPRGVTVRALEPREYGEYAARQNACYRDHNLYPPLDADAIAASLALAPGGRQIYRCFVATDLAGNLLAGAQVWCRGQLKTDTFTRPPAPLRALNRLVRFLPADYVIREIGVRGLWYSPGRLPVARYLWEAIRWHCKEDGTTFGIVFDARDPAREAMQRRPWHGPRFEIAVAIHGPAPLDRDRLLFARGRV